MIITLAQIKQYFETADIPTEAEYINTWDSFRHKNDDVPEIFENVTDSYVTVAATLPLPALGVAAIEKIMRVKIETGGIWLTLAYNTGMGYQINTAQSRIEFLDRNGSTLRTLGNVRVSVQLINNT